MNIDLDPEETPKVDDLEIKDEQLTKPKLENKMSEVNGTPVLTDKPGLQFGIEETKDVVKFGTSLANAIITALKDGKIGLTDLPAFVAPLTKLPAALSGIANVPAELSDLTELEMQELREAVQNDLEVDDAKAKVIVDKSINVLYAIYGLVKEVQQ